MKRIPILFKKLLKYFRGIFKRKPAKADVQPFAKTEKKAIPYGIGSYELMREGDYYYVDKTGYLRVIEKASPYLFFIRPRRFGKTLFISMMETYYDIYKRDQFERYFKGTGIFENPTHGRGSYLILKFDFSAVMPSVEQVEESFLNHTKDVVEYFVSKYKDLLNVDVKETVKELKNKRNPTDILNGLLNLCRIAAQKVYVIIDEYDNFANTILSTAGKTDYEKLTHGEGFFKSFFNAVKTGTSSSDTPITRLFMTGVSPITLDDVTSGFNIGENISTDSAFTDIMGFREQEVTEFIEYYRSRGEIRHDTDYLMDVMSRWYNHYRFSKESDIKVFNPTLVLHFLKEYFKNYKIPDELFDRNVRMDYWKLRYLIILDKKGIPETNGNFSKLKAVIEDGFVSSKIEKGFPLEKLGNPENFSSLLFYFGLLTIDEVDKGDKLKLVIPNETIKKLFYEYITEVYTETRVFRLDVDKYSKLMENMAYNGEWGPLFDYITRLMAESMGLRDLITAEKSIQGFLNAYLGLTNFYEINSEKELNKGYADLVLEPFTAKYEGLKYSYLIEIKYMKRSETKNKEKIHRLKVEAEEQLKQYGLDKKFRNRIRGTTLIKLVLVFSGHQLVYIGETDAG